MPDLIVSPIATPITDAFHVNMKSAPTPYKNENNTQKINTFRLFDNMSRNILT